MFLVYNMDAVDEKEEPVDVDDVEPDVAFSASLNLLPSFPATSESSVVFVCVVRQN